MPICNITKHSDPLQVLSKVLDKDGAILMHTNCIGRSPEALHQEFMILIDSYRSTPYIHSNQVVHQTMIAFESGTHLNQATCIAIAYRYMEAMEFSPYRNQYVLVHQPDVEHPHLQVVVNRVQLNRKLNQICRGDWLKAQRAMRQIEEEFSLPALASSWEVDIKAPTAQEIHRAERTGQPIPRVVIQQALDLLIPQCRSLEELAIELENRLIKLTVTPYPDSTHPTTNSLTFDYGGLKFTPNKLGKRYSYRAIQQVWAGQHSEPSSFN